MGSFEPALVYPKARVIENSVPNSNVVKAHNKPIETNREKTTNQRSKVTNEAPKALNKRMRSSSPDMMKDPGCAHELRLEEQDTLELICQDRIQSCQAKRLSKTQSKLSYKFESICKSGLIDMEQNFLSTFSPQVKAHSLHPENPFVNIDVKIEQHQQELEEHEKNYVCANLLFNSHRSFTDDSGAGSVDNITSQLSPAHIAMNSCYSHFDKDDSSSIQGANNSVSTPRGTPDKIIWFNNADFRGDFNYKDLNQRGLFDN
jgi:hypothetical protein